MLNGDSRDPVAVWGEKEKENGGVTNLQIDGHGIPLHENSIPQLKGIFLHSTICSHIDRGLRTTLNRQGIRLREGT